MADREARRRAIEGAAEKVRHGSGYTRRHENVRYERILVSGYYEAARSYAREHGLRQSEWRHVSTPEQLSGYRNGILVAVHGSRWDVEREARLRGMSVDVTAGWLLDERNELISWKDSHISPTHGPYGNR